MDRCRRRPVLFLVNAIEPADLRCGEMLTESKGTEVYHLATQLIPLTEPDEKVKRVGESDVASSS